MARRNETPSGPQGPGFARAWGWARRRARRSRLTPASILGDDWFPPDDDEPGGGLAGVREPRRPNPPPDTMAAACDLPWEDAPEPWPDTQSAVTAPSALPR